MINGKKVKAIILLMFSICFCLCSCSKRYSSIKIEDYEIYLYEVYNAELYMPRIDSLGNYESIFVGRKTPGDVFFNTNDSIALIVQYDFESYDYEFSRIRDSYRFLVEAQNNLQDVEAVVDGFNFQIVKGSNCFEGSATGDFELTGHSILIIGYDEINYRIAYLYHYDHSNSFIEDLDKLIKKQYVLE